MFSHTPRLYAASLAPLAALYYWNAGLATAVVAATATVTAIRELLQRRKPSA
ncbi:hypothetical protein [Streptomyces caniscabiei]|uniref:Uncharacterized protein n=1 Tax=Streptomyces caniscabiei TaxID=2746961 RepID=A0ABU4MYG1_9ACTN|nr:hypothetical protein [Streptomyces caniscabiei]MBE4761714.1 hypothetical protein [Streptomyces caniscabiei]MBE4790258.1 hypothetical protein [Streptomyces caniscabiei]MBE4799513.1 hypothetical protein [Streptomyces caniscabiei]MDX2947956.1 hypothetical protein [Streptomyces caniscabiei]MDX3015115.1 hypothetical protein [Streptomyces caniscabiei]